MPGNNSGNQLNILLFEVGYLIDDENLRTLGRDARTVCIHCMEVVPETISTQHKTRSTVSQNMAGATITHGGVGLRAWSMQGHFGVEVRGIGGTGPARYERFTREVVRLSEALSQKHVDEAKNILLQSPGLGLALRDYDEKRCVFYVNFYNLWDGVACQAFLPSFQPTRAYGNAGATGNVTYSLTVQEIGPLVKGGIGADLLTPLLNVLTTWDDANEALKGVRLQALLDTVTGPAAVVGNLLGESITAVLNTVADVQSLFGASSSGSAGADVSSGGTWLDGAQGVVRYGLEMAALLEAAGAYDSSAGAMDPGTASETERLGAETVRAVNLAAVRQAVDAAELNLSMGRLYGIEDQTFQAIAAAGGPDYYPAPDVGPTRDYVVQEFDTIGRIEATTGVDWVTIQSLNNLSARVALIPGTVLRIPVTRPRGPQGVNGLPILGSHQGDGAYGVDLHVELLDNGASPQADLLTVSGEANLRQAITTITTEIALPILDRLDAIPAPGRARYIQEQMKAAILVDRRFTTAACEATAKGSIFEVVNTVTTISDGSIEVAQEIVYE